RNNQGRRKDNKPMDAERLARKALNFLNNHFGEEFSEKEIIKKLELRDAFSKSNIGPVLQELASAGSISRNPRNKYSSTSDPEFIQGRVDYVNSRFAYVIPENQAKSTDDILVKENDLKNALDGDIVRVMVFPNKGRS